MQWIELSYGVIQTLLKILLRTYANELPVAGHLYALSEHKCSSMAYKISRSVCLNPHSDVSYTTQTAFFTVLYKISRMACILVLHSMKAVLEVVSCNISKVSCTAVFHVAMFHAAVFHVYARSAAWSNFTFLKYSAMSMVISTMFST
jgi:hypothetical protein